MKFYLAPMEGITGYIYRNVFSRVYGQADRYFAPFIMSKKMNQKEIRDILPENNPGIELIPQILANRTETFLAIAEKIRSYGYETVNLNLGCPSPTVTARNRGAGFLALPEELDHFLEEIFAACPLKISIKTRIGTEEEDQWPGLLEIYEKYPLEELIIHPRLKTDQYKPCTIHRKAFAEAALKSRHSLCYNGDIQSLEDYREVRQCFPHTEKIMIGRGILRKPWLFQELQSGRKKEEKLQREKLKEFHDQLLEGYMNVMSGDTNTLYKMKELWAYLGTSFREPEPYLKKIRKAQRISEYRIWTDRLFREGELVCEAVEKLPEEERESSEGNCSAGII